MKGYFSFDWVYEEKTLQKRVDFRFLFKAPGTLKIGSLADAIETSVRTILFPDVIVIICMQDEVDIVKSSFQTSELRQAANRTSKKIGLYVCAFDKEGNLGEPVVIRNRYPLARRVLRENIEEITLAGLESLFSARHVLVTAPAGFTFVKPSGERSRRFLKTEEALTEIEGVQFLSFALLRRLSAREKTLGQSVEVIYIDSMAIASVAYALREMYCMLFQCPRPRVVSFHSHDGFADLESPLPGTSFCMISASSSMRLEQKWKEKTHCHPTEVVTLLTLERADHAEDALYALPDVIQEEALKTETEGVLKDLRITGERFIPEQIVPKKVLLKGLVHRVDSAVAFSKYFRGANKLSIQCRGSTATAKVRAIHLRGDSLLQSSDFEAFLLKVLRQRTPASIQAVIHQDDDASQLLARRCVQELGAIMGKHEPLPMISQSELEVGDVSLDTTKAILIVAAVIGRGTKLLSISRDLRPIHTGARTYVIGAQIAETQAQITALGRNLSYSAEKAHIVVETFAKVAVGVGLSDSYLDEFTILSRLPENIQCASIRDRLDKIQGSTIGLAERAFIPCGKHLDNPLRLRPDFAYWNFKYREEEVNLPAVFLSVAAILQNAREASFDSPENRLATDAFQQVVLDPENFSRYNDGVIQAALLRAAHPGELDYSSEPSASEYMLDLLTKVLIQHERPQGEAALEFALALRSGRLKLAAKDITELRNRVQDALLGETAQKTILRMFLGLEVAAQSMSVPEDF